MQTTSLSKTAISKIAILKTAISKTAILCLTIELLLAGSSLARAAEPDDCGPRPNDKTLPACSAIIDDTTRPQPDHVRALLNRARAYFTQNKPDLSLADVNAA